MDNRKYNGKVILFGEYSMIFGSNALLIPYYSVSGEWSSIINRPCERGIESNRNLFKYFDYLRENDRFRILDLRRMEMELNAGLFFDSNIPTGYGVGSSGALVAAIYDRFKLVEIKETDRLTPGGEHGNPLQYSCLENPMDRGAWWATVHGVVKSQARLNY